MVLRALEKRASKPPFADACCDPSSDGMPAPVKPSQHTDHCKVRSSKAAAAGQVLSSSGLNSEADLGVVRASSSCT